jgi:hypothetical protein
MSLETFTFCHAGTVSAQCRAAEGVPEPWDEINRFALRPLAPEEVAVFTLDLCHNQIDRHYSRFPEEELQKINERVVGRPLMERHDLRGTLPRGTFFRSVLHREGEKVTVRPDVYVLRTGENADFIRNIEGGVYRETSIGFTFRFPECSVCHKDLRTCAHIPGRTYGDHLCHFILRDVVDVLEGSVVAAGSQGTAFVAQRALPLEAALEEARRRYHKPITIQTRPLWSEE